MGSIAVIMIVAVPYKGPATIMITFCFFDRILIINVYFSRDTGVHLQK